MVDDVFDDFDRKCEFRKHRHDVRDGWTTSTQRGGRKRERATRAVPQAILKTSDMIRIETK